MEKDMAAVAKEIQCSFTALPPELLALIPGRHGHARDVCSFLATSRACRACKADVYEEAAKQRYPAALLQRGMHRDYTYFGGGSYRMLLENDAAAVGVWAVEISGAASLWRDNGLPRAGQQHAFYEARLQMVAWSLKEPHLVHVLIDAVGERDLRAAHSTTLVIESGQKFTPLRFRYKNGASASRCRQICALSYDAAVLSKPASLVHFIYGNDGEHYTAPLAIRLPDAAQLPPGAALPRAFFNDERVELAGMSDHRGTQQRPVRRMRRLGLVPRDLLEAYDACARGPDAWLELVAARLYARLDSFAPLVDEGFGDLGS